MTTNSTTTTCPSWCDEGSSCSGFHYSPRTNYIAATASAVTQGVDSDAPVVPALAVSLRWAESFGEGVEIALDDPSSTREHVFPLRDGLALMTELATAMGQAWSGLRAIPGDHAEFFEAVETMSVAREATARKTRTTDRGMERVAVSPTTAFGDVSVGRIKSPTGDQEMFVVDFPGLEIMSREEAVEMAAALTNAVALIDGETRA